nr:hypothetical protein [Allomuricauda sp.]
MTYKIKSLIYFFCFLAASSIYYVVEQHEEFQKQLHAKELAETEFDDSMDHENPKKDLQLAQE